MIEEFVGFATEGGQTTTSPVAARNSVAAGVAGTLSLRNGGGAVDVPPVRGEVLAYFNGGQE